MSEPNTEQDPNANQPDDNQTGQQNSDTEHKGHPAHREILDLLPEELHGLVQPKLNEWDRGVQDRFQEIHSEYEPWKEFENQGISAQDADQALRFLQMFNENPEDVIRQAIEHFNLNLGQEDDDYDDNDLDDEDYEDDEDDPNDRRYRELRDSQRDIDQRLSDREQADLDAQADDALDQYLDELEEEFGPYDEQYVLSLMGQGIRGEDAVQQFLELYERYGTEFGDSNVDEDNSEGQAGDQNSNQNGQQQQQNGAPIVGGSGGTIGSGMPSNDVKPGQLSSEQTEDLVTQLLERAANER